MSDQRTDVDPYALVLSDLFRRRDDIQKQKEEIDAAIRAIESVRGLSPVAALLEVPTSKKPVLFDGENFQGLSIAEASKKLLSIRKRDMHSAEIAEQLRASGYPMTATDPSNVVASVLSRRFDSVGDIVRVSRGRWGLLEWYPNQTFRKKEQAPTVQSIIEAPTVGLVKPTTALS